MSAFETLLLQYYNAINGWEAIGISLAKELFILLAGIQIVWATIMWVLNRNDTASILSEFARLIITTGFFWAFLLNYDVWIPAIYAGLQKTGENMAGVTSVSPGDIFDTGWTIATTIFNSAKNEGFWASFGGTILASICGFIIFFIFLLIAAELTIVLVGGKMILAGGLILLGLSGTKWTMSYAERYFTFAISLGIRLLFLTLIVGLGQTLATGWIDIINNPPNGDYIDGYLAVMGAAVLYMIFARRIPEMAVAGLTGNLAFNGFSSSISHTAQVGARAGAKAGSIAAGAVIGASKETAGGVSALRAATNAGFQQTAENGQSALSVVPNAIKTLGGATGQVAKESITGFAQNNLRQTVGGKIADKIKADTGGSL
jgi:type IV secretion system protein TrbL